MKTAAFIFLYLAWPITLVHRYWNNKPPKVVNWFVFYYEPQDVQWYVSYTGTLLMPMFIMLGSLFYVLSRARYTVYFVISIIGMLCVQTIEIANYWLYYGQNDGLLYLQGLLLLMAGSVCLILSSNGTKRNTKYHV